MKSIYRSEEMTLCQIYFQMDVAFACLSEMGDIGIVQFQELNPDLNTFQRKYVLQVRRCDEMERKLRFLDKEVKLRGMQQKFPARFIDTPTHKEISYIEGKLDLLDEEIRTMHQTLKDLNHNLMELVELKFVLLNTQTFFEAAETAAAEASSDAATSADVDLLLHEQRRDGPRNRRLERERAELAAMRLGFMAGVMRSDKMTSFERVLWRSGHGNILLRFYDINETIVDPETSDHVIKVVFIVFCQGDILKERVRRICEGFHATIYPCPDNSADRREQSTRVGNTIQDLKLIIGKSEEHVLRILAASAKAIPKWSVQIRKAKAIYHTMNMFAYDMTTNCLVAECWIPDVDVLTVSYALKKATDISGNNIAPILNRMKTNADPPTFNRVNKFTQGFQTLVDAYGVASYREVNPAAFTIITFPFLFAIMFGDAGHGLIMTLFGFSLILAENTYKVKPGDELAKIFFGGRYIILLMGLFSIYTGMIYNDVFSRTTNLFGRSSWRIRYNRTTVFDNVKSLQLDPGDPEVYGSPYAFGIDPAWAFAENKISFLNSYKMKISIILGVMHMLFGVIASHRNYTYFKKRLSIWCEFVPQVIFLVALFGYLAFLMVFKWFFYGAQARTERGPYCAPSILIKFIDMVLLKSGPQLPGCQRNMFPAQETIQYVLLGVALVCVPWMLFAKPLAIMARHRRRVMRMISASFERSREAGQRITARIEQAEQEVVQHTYEPVDTDEQPRSYSAQFYEPYIDDKSLDSKDSDDSDDDNEMSEMFIHQAIHTIEYVLGSVSHTASYLRLWALSLAHQQLSEVLWNMIIGQSLTMFEEETFFRIANVLAIVIAFAFWGVLTIGVLVLMEGLSAFLHTLRLHWVEFQSKFYHGLGYRFTPFSFAIILETLEAERAELGLA